jgi:BirA family biotin operon repressor/biotin-[acetyl-CoA-carboxylase] ligase
VWGRVDVVESTESTNADLLADTGAPDRTVRVAEVQTAGRGRLDRQWSSAYGAGLTFSVLLRPVASPASWGWLPLLAGVALRDAVSAHARCTLKWPNDLLAADGDKLAGILAQTAADAVVVGIGLNVTTQREELPVPTATSLALQGARPDRTALLGQILLRLGERYDAWQAAGGDAFASGLAADYRAACSTIGATVRVETPAGTLVGRAIDVDAGGRLVLDAGGTRHTVAAGDVTHVR